MDKIDFCVSLFSFFSMDNQKLKVKVGAGIVNHGAPVLEGEFLNYM